MPRHKNEVGINYELQPSQREKYNEMYNAEQQERIEREAREERVAEAKFRRGSGR